MNKNQNLWFPVDPDTNANVFTLFKDDDCKLTVAQEFYPDVNLIEKLYRPIVKGANDPENGSGKKIYRLEDADGSEITIEQMVKKYFSHPETCFKIDERKIANE